MEFKSEKIRKFEEALSKDKDLAQKYEDIIKRIVENKEAGSDGEAMVKAAAELGYDIPIEELERSYAAIAEVSDESLDSVAGGESDEPEEYDYRYDEDEYGHDLCCYSLWHCYTTFMHTKTKLRKERCWSDYHCVFVSTDHNMPG